MKHESTSKRGGYPTWLVVTGPKTSPGPKYVDENLPPSPNLPAIMNCPGPAPINQQPTQLTDTVPKKPEFVELRATPVAGSIPTCTPTIAIMLRACPPSSIPPKNISFVMLMFCTETQTAPPNATSSTSDPHPLSASIWMANSSAPGSATILMELSLTTESLSLSRSSPIPRQRKRLRSVTTSCADGAEPWNQLRSKQLAVPAPSIVRSRISARVILWRCNKKPEVPGLATRSEEHTSELQSRPHLVCRLLLEK